MNSIPMEIYPNEIYSTEILPMDCNLDPNGDGTVAGP